MDFSPSSPAPDHRDALQNQEQSLPENKANDRESVAGESVAGESVADESVADESVADESVAGESPLASAPAAPTPRAAAHAEFNALFLQWKESGDPVLRERLILSQRNLVSYLARRFLDRGELSEDVMQVGMVGLINALDAFDASRGLRFSTFAIPSISGEIRRYFRDKMWGMRVPRRMQENYVLIQNRVEELTQKFSRSPTYAEIAFSLQLEVEEVVEIIELGNALDPQSLDEHVFGDADSVLADTLGALDPDLEAYEERTALQMALSRLPENERRVLEMAYFEGFSQADIARRQGVSQMHVSRLLRRALTELRHLLEDI